MALSPELGLQAEDWARMGVLMVLFALYLAVFTAFGLWVSALTQRRITAFLALLGLWTLWIFVIPNLTVRTARSLTPVASVYDLEKRGIQARWETRSESRTDIQAYFEQIK